MVFFCVFTRPFFCALELRKCLLYPPFLKRTPVLGDKVPPLLLHLTLITLFKCPVSSWELGLQQQQQKNQSVMKYLETELKIAYKYLKVLKMSFRDDSFFLKYSELFRKSNSIVYRKGWKQKHLYFCSFPKSVPSASHKALLFLIDSVRNLGITQLPSLPPNSLYNPNPKLYVFWGMYVWNPPTFLSKSPAL